MIFDGHSDLLYDVTRRRLAGERRVLERHHLDRLRRGNIEGLVLAVWTSAAPETFWKEIPGADSAAARTERMLRAAHGSHRQRGGGSPGIRADVCLFGH